jgi:hypothetical protein
MPLITASAVKRDSRKAIEARGDREGLSEGLGWNRLFELHRENLQFINRALTGYGDETGTLRCDVDPNPKHGKPDGSCGRRCRDLRDLA